MTSVLSTKISSDSPSKLEIRPIKYCQKHDILKEFLKLHAAEVLGMLYTEWKLEDAIAVAREEAWENGLAEGKLEIARNLLAEDATLEFVQKITGLDIDTIRELRNEELFIQK